MFSQRSRAVRARRGVPLAIVAMVCLLVSLLGPLQSASAAAVPNAAATNAATQPPQQPTQPPQQPTTAPTQAQPTSAPPTQAPPTQPPTKQAQTGSLVIYKYACDPGYDPTKQGANPVQDCQKGQNGVQFNITGQNSGYTSQTNTGDSISGAVMFGGIPYDNYTVVEKVPQGFGQPLVFCGTQNVPPQQQQLQPIQITNGNQVTLPVQTPNVVCGWYNIPAATGTITVYKFACPPGYNPTAQGADPVTDCQQAQNGVQFNLAGQNTGYTSQSNTGDSINGAVTFGGLQPDTYTITEKVPQGYGEPLVLCSASQDQNPKAALFERVQVKNGNTITVQLQTPYLTCRWYNIPTAAPSSPTAPPTQPSTPPAGTPPSGTPTVGTPPAISSPSAHNLPPGSGATLQVELHLCPDFDPAADPNATNISTTCTGHMGGVTFHVTANGQPQPDQHTQGGNVSAWFLAGLPPGDGAVVIDLPAGYGSSIVECGIDNPASGQQFFYQNVPVAYGTTIHTKLVDAATTACQWFILPPGQIAINKHGCPTDFDPTNATLNDLAQKCKDPQPGVKFTATKSGGQTEDQTTPNTGLSLVTFKDLAAPTDIQIAETTPAGFGTPIVYCKVVNPIGPITGPVRKMVIPVGISGAEQKMDITGGTTITWPLKPAQLVFCDWFNIPVGSIYINKHGCPQGFDPTNKTIYDLAANCHDSLAGVTFTLTKGTTTVATGQTAGTPTAVLFKNLQPGQLTITETLPTGYISAVVYCKVLGKNGGPSGPEQNLPFDATNRSVKWTVVGGQDVFCDWFNIKSNPSTVTIHKWLCPKDYDPTKQGAKPKTDCAQPESGIDFTLTDSATTTKMTTGANGQVQWTNVQPGPITITESVPNGYGVPFVTCSDVNTVQGPVQVVLTPNGVYKTILAAGHSIVCDWYNIPRSPGSITIYKWVCPAGYDITAGGADPKKDCAQPVNGIQFNLAGKNTGYTSQSNTGDSIPGAVTFGGIQPDTYTVTETVPADAAMVFVGDCTGGTNAAVHPFPLSTGNVLKIDLGGGDKIVCNWYNVPQVKGGDLTVHKQVCSTPTFVSTLDCQTFSGGQAFTVLGWNGAQWVVVANGTTNNLGVVSFTGLTPGTYQVQEPGKTPCSIMSQGLQKGGGLTVNAGQETVVWVYNCNVKSTPQPPTKFPNTGVGPIDSASGGGPGAGLPLLLTALALALLAAAATMCGLFRSVRLPAMRRPSPRRPRRGLAMLLAGTIVISSVALGLAPAAAQPTIVAPNTCVPTPVKLPKNASKVEKASVQADAASITAAAALNPTCNEVPVAITIKAAHVNAKIEVLEIIDGVMQAPTGADVVSWYKQSPRLGQPGNMLMAGHLNWWGVPQAVFFYLNTLQKGDLIQVTGQGGEVYTYRVEWNRLEDATKPPTSDVVGPTKVPSLTLITCGGTWIPAASEYDSRTVVRATFVSVQKPKK